MNTSTHTANAFTDAFNNATNTDKLFFNVDTQLFSEFSVLQNPEKALRAILRKGVKNPAKAAALNLDNFSHVRDGRTIKTVSVPVDRKLKKDFLKIMGKANVQPYEFIRACMQCSVNAHINTNRMYSAIGGEK